jgi:outer membrane protein TolC
MKKFAAPRSSGSQAARLGLLVFVGLAALGESVRAQEKIAAPPSKLGLDQCIQLGLDRQPALAAARASLAAAESGEQGISNLPRIANLVQRDLRIRREQACIGVDIAAAGLRQAEWETRYAVRRTFYSVQYAREQEKVISRALDKISEAYKKAKKLVDAGNPDFKVTAIDLKVLEINAEFVKTKQAEARVGVLKAIAALREAVGVGVDYPLELVAEPLPALVDALNKDELISQARVNRGELEQVMLVNRVTELEIDAQRRNLFKMQVGTFAQGADIHVKPVPTGVSNSEYRPGAIGPEMPPFMFGKRPYRVQRAEDLNQRSVAVVDKTQNLVALEVEVTYLEWTKAAQDVRGLSKTPKLAQDIAKDVKTRFDDGKLTAEDYLRARTLEDQAQAQLNQAMYEHALALAALERVTAGGYRFTASK